MKTLLAATILLCCAAQGWAADTLLYDPFGDYYIESVLTNLGITYDLRSSGTPVTAADLASHSLLVVGWNEGGNTSGLSSSILAAGITGRIVLTGHDPDYHAINGSNSAACYQFLTQAMAFARRSGGTGMVALSDYSGTYSYLPSSWGVTKGSTDADTITSITPDGLASGIYNGMTEASMSGWGEAYHNSFSAYGSKFKVMEIGSYSDAVTIATPEPATLSLLVLGGLALLRRRARR